MNNIIFLGCTQDYGFQFSAANTKINFLAKGLKELEDCCIIHNGVIGTHKISQRKIKTDPKIGTIITYPKKWNQLISWIFNIPQLFKDLKVYHRKDCKNYVILEAPDYHIYLLYILIARILKYKIVVISHEWTTTITTTHILRKPSVNLYAATFGYFTDAILPISEYIIKKIQHFKRPYIKIPITAEFNQLNSKKTNLEKYFLYCVYAAYTRVIFQIINAFTKYKTESTSNDSKLILVLSGDQEHILAIQNYINTNELQKDIEVKSKIPYSTLLDLYSNAQALIIPLDPNNEQDEARFSQKTAEYLSSGSPIISNNVGEIKHYFTDKKNIILCNYDVNGFIDAFKWVSNHPTEAKQIGINGFYLGKKEFDYRVLAQRLHNFLEEI